MNRLDEIDPQVTQIASDADVVLSPDATAASSGVQKPVEKRCIAKQTVACPQDVLLASVTLALTLSKGRSQYEIETLINLFSLTTDNLQSILAQLLINRKSADELDLII